MSDNMTKRVTELTSTVEEALEWCLIDATNEDGYPTQEMLDNRVEVLTEALEPSSLRERDERGDGKPIVYVVVFEGGWDGDEVKGVFASNEAAEQYVLNEAIGELKTDDADTLQDWWKKNHEVDASLYDDYAVACQYLDELGLGTPDIQHHFVQGEKS